MMTHQIKGTIGKITLFHGKEVYVTINLEDGRCIPYQVAVPKTEATNTFYSFHSGEPVVADVECDNDSHELLKSRIIHMEEAAK